MFISFQATFILFIRFNISGANWKERIVSSSTNNIRKYFLNARVKYCWVQWTSTACGFYETLCLYISCTANCSTIRRIIEFVYFILTSSRDSNLCFYCPIRAMLPNPSPSLICWRPIARISFKKNLNDQLLRTFSVWWLIFIFWKVTCFISFDVTKIK